MESIDKGSLPRVLYVDSLKHNLENVSRTRILFSLVFGAFSGWIGVINYAGILGFVLANVLSILLIMLRMQWNPHKFLESKISLLFEGFFSGLFTYLLAWTFVINIRHVF